jgi:flagellar motor switch/type III secretory pathway protein FliN
MSAPSAADPRARYRGFESVPIRLTVRLGRLRLRLSRLAELREGDVLALERSVGAPFDLVAGEIVLGRVQPVALDADVAFKLVGAGEDDDGSPA